MLRNLNDALLLAASAFGLLLLRLLLTQILPLTHYRSWLHFFCFNLILYLHHTIWTSSMKTSTQDCVSWYCDNFLNLSSRFCSLSFSASVLFRIHSTKHILVCNTSDRDMSPPKPLIWGLLLLSLKIDTPTHTAFYHRLKQS